MDVIVIAGTEIPRFFDFPGILPDETRKLYTSELNKLSYILGENDEKLPLSVLAFRDYLEGKLSPDYSHEKYLLKEAECCNTLTLNGVYLYQYLKSRGLNPELINNLEAEKRRFVELVEENPNAVIAVSTTFIYSIAFLNNIIEDLREIKKDLCIVAGGPLINKSFKIEQEHPLFEKHKDYIKGVYFTSLSNIDIDYFVISQLGENTLFELVDSLRNNKDIEEVKNLLIKKEKSWEYTGFKKETVNFEKDPEILNWKDIDQKYLRPTVSIRASRGCRFRCRFCDFVVDPGDNLQKEMSSLLKELRMIASRGSVSSVEFVDDDFFLSSDEVTQFTKILIKENLPLKWRGFLRADFVTEENIHLLRDSGCESLMIGVESGDPGILKNMKKGTSPEKMHQGIELLNSVGINTLLFFIVGYPGETQKTIDNTINFINHIKDSDKAVNYVFTTPFMIMPFAPVDSSKDREQYGLEGIMGSWSHNTMDVKEAVQKMTEINCSVKFYYHFCKDLGQVMGQYQCSMETVKPIFRLQQSLLQEQYEGNIDWNQRKKVLAEYRTLIQNL